MTEFDYLIMDLQELVRHDVAHNRIFTESLKYAKGFSNAIDFIHDKIKCEDCPCYNGCRRCDRDCKDTLRNYFANSDDK